MWRMRLVPLLLSLLAACASGPTFDTSRVDHSLSPRRVAGEAGDSRGKQVLWGGVILSIANLKDSTQIEALAYPLDSNNRPRRDSDALGRFVIEHTGYLEPATYAEGRLVTVVGTVLGSRSGKIGESDYAFPVISTQNIYLWPKDSGYDGSNVHFGIGVGIGF